MLSIEEIKRLLNSESEKPERYGSLTERCKMISIILSKREIFPNKVSLIYMNNKFMLSNSEFGIYTPVYLESVVTDMDAHNIMNRLISELNIMVRKNEKVSNICSHIVYSFGITESRLKSLNILNYILKKYFMIKLDTKIINLLTRKLTTAYKLKIKEVIDKNYMFPADKLMFVIEDFSPYFPSDVIKELYDNFGEQILKYTNYNDESSEETVYAIKRIRAVNFIENFKSDKLDLSELSVDDIYGILSVSPKFIFKIDNPTNDMIIKAIEHDNLISLEFEENEVIKNHFSNLGMELMFKNDIETQSDKLIEMILDNPDYYLSSASLKLSGNSKIKLISKNPNLILDFYISKIPEGLALRNFYKTENFEAKKLYMNALNNNDKVKLIEKDGSLIKYLSNPSYTMQKLAIKYNALNIRYIDLNDRLRDIEEIAVRSDKNALKYVYRKEKVLNNISKNTCYIRFSDIENIEDVVSTIVRRTVF